MRLVNLWLLEFNDLQGLDGARGEVVTGFWL